MPRSAGDSRVERFSRGPYVFGVIDSGPLDGVPVVLLHGFPQRAHSWSAVAERLNDAGVRTFAPDQRGYSPGARPSSRRAYRPAELIDDVVALIDAVGAHRVHLVGHDWGAAVAWAVAGRHPDRLASLTTLSVPHPAAFAASMPRGQALSSWYMAVFNLPVLPELLLSRVFRPGGRALDGVGLPAERAQNLYADIVEYGAVTGALNWYRGFVFGIGDLRVPTVRVPTTHIWSDRDVALKRAGATMTGGYVDAPYQLIVVKGANHWLPERRPDEVSAAILDRIESVESRIT